MSSSKLSPEAAHEKYLYLKKYQDSYWERRAAKRKAEQSGQTISVEISIDDTSESVDVSVRRSGKTQEQYIRDLEKSNRTLSSENRRLVKLLAQYQEIIRIGTNNCKGYEIK